MAPGGWNRARAQTCLPLMSTVRAGFHPMFTWRRIIAILRCHSLRGTDLTQFIRMRLKDAQCLMGAHLSAGPIHV